MPRADGRLEPGQPIRGAISARAWNRAQDAADVVLGAHAGTMSGTLSYARPPFTSILATSDFNMTMGYTYSISGLETPVNSMWEMPVVRTSTPFQNGSLVSYCVAVEPIASGKVGRVAVDGVVPAWVRFDDDNHTCANYGSWGGGDTPSLFSSYVGTSQILYKSDSVFDSQYLCLVKLNAHKHQMRTGVLVDGYSDYTWSPGASLPFLLDDAAGLPSSVVSVQNRVKPYHHVSSGACAYIFCNGAGFELINVSGLEAE